jgi:hypothetical protein
MTISPADHQIHNIKEKRHSKIKTATTFLRIEKKMSSSLLVPNQRLNLFEMRVDHQYLILFKMRVDQLFKTSHLDISNSRNAGP